MKETCVGGGVLDAPLFTEEAVRAVGDAGPYAYLPIDTT